LHLPLDAKVMMERYSDSAAAYVMLDPANASVYKQLYRAAKAKSKLKLRVTILNREERTSPKPVTVEDEVEAAPAAEAPESATMEAEVPALTTATAPDSLGALAYATSTPVATTLSPDNSTEAWNRVMEEQIQKLKQNNTNIAALASQLGVKCRVTDSDDASAAMNNSSATTLAPTQSGAPACAFAVCCNSCDKTIPEAHFHCSTCEDGDFDLCQSCVERGITCYSNEHWLIKRTVKDGQIVNSTTETIAPKPKAETQQPKPAEEEFPRSLPVSCSYIPGRYEQPPNPCVTADRWGSLGNMRTCNCCVRGT